MKKYIALSMLILVTGLFGQGRSGFGRELGWNDDLNLTSEQIKQIDSYRTDFRKTQIDLRADIQKMRLDLQDLLRSDDPNQKAIIVSGFSECERVNLAQELGAGEFVKKPLTKQAIAVAVRTELDKSAKVLD